MLINLFTLIAQAQVDPIFGKVSPPPGVSKYDIAAGASGIGLILFISNIIKIVTIGAGLFGFFNIISAGYVFLQSNGNVKAAEEANNKLVMSLIGLALIVGSYTIAAIVGLILFGDPTFILNPKIPQAP